MLPHQFKRLLEMLRSQLGTIHEAVKNQESAIRDATEAAEKKWREVPGIIASSILGTAKDKESAEAQKATSSDQQERLISSQGKLVFWTRLAFAAAAIAAGAAIYYAQIAKGQLETMNHTYCEIRKQTSLLTEQIKGTQAAFLEGGPSLGFKVGDFDTAFNVIKLVIRNSGHAIAKDIKISSTVKQMTIRGEQIGQPIIYNVSSPVLGFTTGTNELYRRYVFEDSQQATRRLNADNRLEEITEFEWSYRYGDGFGDTITSDVFCRDFLGNDWIPCENLAAALRDLKSKSNKQ